MNHSVQHTTGIVLGEAWQLLLQEIHARQPGVIAGEDAEELHQFRVALRKTRALLRLFRCYLPESDAIAREFKWLSDALNPARDLDIVAQFVQRTADRSILNERRTLAVCSRELERQRAVQHKALQTLLRGRRYKNLCSDWHDYVEHCLRGAALPITLRTGAATSQRVIAIQQMLTLLRWLRRVDDHCEPATLHRLRIRCKRLRYLFDALPMDDDKRFAALRKALARLQCILGEHQDAVVIREWFVHFSDRRKHNIEIPVAWFVAIEKQQRSVLVALPRAWHALVKACKQI